MLSFHNPFYKLFYMNSRLPLEVFLILTVNEPELYTAPPSGFPARNPPSSALYWPLPMKLARSWKTVAPALYRPAPPRGVWR